MCIRETEKRSDYLDLQVNDRVFYAPYGYGVVLSNTNSTRYPFRVRWDSDGKWSTFTRLGYLLSMKDLQPNIMEYQKSFVIEKLKKVP